MAWRPSGGALRLVAGGVCVLISAAVATRLVFPTAASSTSAPAASSVIPTSAAASSISAAAPSTAAPEPAVGPEPVPSTSGASATTATSSPPSSTAPVAPSPLTDVAYGDASPLQRLDLHLPADARSAPVPVVVYFHGGGWIGGDKADPADLAVVDSLVAHGLAVASVNYRLAPDAVFPAQLDDAHAAIEWLRSNGATYGIDADRIATFGESAGAHLAVLAALTAPAGTAHAVVDWAGPTDLTDLRADMSANPQCRDEYVDPDDPTSYWARFVGGPVSQHRDVAETADLTLAARAGASSGRVLPAILVVHGDRDCTVPIQQSERLVAALDGAPGASVTFVRLPGAGHVQAFPAVSEVGRAADFLDRALRE